MTCSIYGIDKANGIITAVSRAVKNSNGSANGNVLWAGTSMGRLFISDNADAVNLANFNDGSTVSFTRIDNKCSTLPGRFVSGLEVDPNNPYRAFISYSGFSVIAPGAHVLKRLTIRVHR